MLAVTVLLGGCSNPLARTVPEPTPVPVPEVPTKKAALPAKKKPPVVPVATPEPEPEPEPAPEPEPEPEPEIAAVILDSDSDGLADKEEEKLGTDPKNPDTDFDGYLDGEEVDNGYDPLRSAHLDQEGIGGMADVLQTAVPYEDGPLPGVSTAGWIAFTHSHAPDFSLRYPASYMEPKMDSRFHPVETTQEEFRLESEHFYMGSSSCTHSPEPGCVPINVRLYQLESSDDLLAAVRNYEWAPKICTNSPEINFEVDGQPAYRCTILKGPILEDYFVYDWVYFMQDGFFMAYDSSTDVNDLAGRAEALAILDTLELD